METQMLHILFKDGIVISTSIIKNKNKNLIYVQPIGMHEFSKTKTAMATSESYV